MAITYNPATNFSAKDSLPTNDPDKVIKGSEFSVEFTAIQTAFGLAAPAASPTFTGTVTIASVDINGGTIDGVTIGGSSAGAITGTTITGTSFVSSGDMTFGDNNKAIFGAGSDLQIYHDGSNSYIEDAGAGVLFIKGTGGVYLRGKDSNEDLGRFLENGAVDLYYDGSSKLATTATGIDVTGTVTADGLTLDSGVYKINNTSTGSGSDKWIGSDGGAGVFVNAGTSGNFNVYNNNSVARIGVNGSTGDISFYEDTGTTPKFFWDASAESLGIGTTSPGYKLSVSATGTISGEFRTSGAISALFLADAGTTAETLYIGTVGNDFRVVTGSNERMRIDSSGLLTNQIGAVFNESGADSDFRVESDTQTHALFVDAGNSRVGIGESSPSQALDVNGNVLADRFITATGTTGSLATSGTADILNLSGASGLWQVSVRNSDGGINWRNSSQVFFNGVSSSSIQTSDSANVTVTMSGTNIRLTNTSGTTIALTWSVTRLL